MDSTPELVRPGYGFLADLCAANEWGLGLDVVEDGDRLALRVYSGRPIAHAEILHAVRFPADLPLDRAADAVFEALHAKGLA